MNGIDFEQELYKHFGQIKDFTLGMRIGQYFYDLGCRRTADKYDEIEYNRQRASGSSEIPNYLEEAAGEYASDTTGFIDMTAYNAFIAGAKWQREQMMKDGNVILAEEDFDAEKEKSMKWGYNLCKEQMLKDAVEGEVVKDISNKLAVTAKGINLDGFKFGQKVRIVVLKEEE